MVSSGLASGEGAFVRRLNLPFWASLAVVIAGYVVAFYVLRLLIPQQEIAGTLAALVLGGGAYVQGAIERRLRAPRGPIVPLAGYQRPWWMLLVAGALAIAAAQLFVPWAQLSGGPVTAVSPNVATVIGLVPALIALLVGAVVGQRADRFGLAAVVGAVLAGYVLGEWLRPLAIQGATGVPMPPDSLPPGLGSPDLPPDPRPVFLGEGFVRFLLENPLPLLTAAAMAGLWYGTRTRLQAYLGGLLRMVRPEDRGAIVALTFETARSTRATDGPSPSAQQAIGEAPAGEPGPDQQGEAPQRE